MSSLRLQDRVSLCRFTFSDGRKCRTPRAGKHPHFCFDHARKESQARSANKLAHELAYFLSGEYLSANDLSAALGRLVPAVLRGDVKPRTARTLAYLAQTLLQTIQLAQHEYINAFGANDWRDAIRDSVNQNFARRNPPTPANPPPVVAGLQTGTSAPQSALPTATSVPQPDPAPPTPLPPTSTEFVQRVVAAVPTGTSAPQPTPVEAGPRPGSSASQPGSTDVHPNICHPEQREGSASPGSAGTQALEAAIHVAIFALQTRGPALP